MLTSWFSQKSPESNHESEKQRRSFDVRYSAERPSTSTDPNPPRSSFDNPRPNPPHTTPHDAVIARLQTSGPNEGPISPNKNDGGRDSSQVDDGQRDGQRSPISPMSPSASRLDLGLSPAPSLYTGATTANVRYGGNQPAGSVQTTTVDVLVDPFDGTTHGVLLPQDINIGPQEDMQSVPRFNSASVAAASEKMWSHLSKVLDLQSQISKMHIDMEGIGAGDGRKKTKGKHSMGRGSGLGEERRMYHPAPSFRARAMSNASTIGTVVDEKEVDEEGVGVTDEETEKNRAREEEFAKLANQFEGKKESIREMMNKVKYLISRPFTSTSPTLHSQLDDLSKALTEFHALQTHDDPNPRSESAASFPPSPPVPIRSSSTMKTVTDRPMSVPPPPLQLPDNMLWAPPKPLVATSSGSTNVLPKSLSRVPADGLKGKTQKPVIPSLVLNADSFLPHVTESPASTLGSLELHPGD
ncbi:hypothetical protein D9611_005646 [Ephemerocybe angulata]|uniref:Uncharacterized protein n=1 Tax=Ephemerocybe angulata TaxID=980116 RepID=A0A8H5BHD6_9AGAR|nr:hypothetical protein D9611_005646 [Tulosesus angulatus]